jgi:dephospho-CoA kinase
MLRIGLTGGIGSGKSTVAALFAACGVPVIDTDEIAHHLVQPGGEALAEVVRAFGASMLAASGELDRAALRARVFADPAERRRLEAILHPRIRAEVAARVAALDANYCVIVVPLLLEAAFNDMVDRVLVVDTTEESQVARARARSGLAGEEVRRIMAAQASRAERLAAAHDVIRNDRDLAHLEREVARLHRLYLSLSTGA